MTMEQSSSIIDGLNMYIQFGEDDEIKRYIYDNFKHRDFSQITKENLKSTFQSLQSRDSKLAASFVQVMPPSKIRDKLTMKVLSALNKLPEVDTLRRDLFNAIGNPKVEGKCHALNTSDKESECIKTSTFTNSNDRDAKIMAILLAQPVSYLTAEPNIPTSKSNNFKLDWAKLFARCFDKEIEEMTVQSLEKLNTMQGDLTRGAISNHLDIFEILFPGLAFKGAIEAEIDPYLSSSGTINISEFIGFLIITGESWAINANEQKTKDILLQWVLTLMIFQGSSCPKDLESIAHKISSEDLKEKVLKMIEEIEAMKSAQMETEELVEKRIDAERQVEYDYALDQVFGAPLVPLVNINSYACDPFKKAQSFAACFEDSLKGIIREGLEILSNHAAKTEQDIISSGLPLFSSLFPDFVNSPGFPCIVDDLVSPYIDKKTGKIDSGQAIGLSIGLAQGVRHEAEIFYRKELPKHTRDPLLHWVLTLMVLHNSSQQECLETANEITDAYKEKVLGIYKAKNGVEREKIKSILSLVDLVDEEHRELLLASIIEMANFHNKPELFFFHNFSSNYVLGLSFFPDHFHFSVKSEDELLPKIEEAFDLAKSLENKNLNASICWLVALHLTLKNYEKARLYADQITIGDLKNEIIGQIGLISTLDASQESPKEKNEKVREEYLP